MQTELLQKGLALDRKLRKEPRTVFRLSIAIAKSVYEGAATLTADMSAVEREISEYMRGNYNTRTRAAVCADVKYHMEGGGTASGMQKERNQLLAALVYPRLYPRAFPRHRGMMLHGAPGTGKTFLIKTVISKVREMLPDVNVLAFTVSGADLKNKGAGDTEKNVKSFFTCMRKMIHDSGTNAMGILFLDEVEELAKARSESGSSRGLVNMLLTQIEGAAALTDKPCSGQVIHSSDNVAAIPIVLLAATNYPDKVDSALRSRLSEELYVALPTVDDIADQAHKTIGDHCKPADAKTNINKAFRFRMRVNGGPQDGKHEKLLEAVSKSIGEHMYENYATRSDVASAIREHLRQEAVRVMVSGVPVFELGNSLYPVCYPLNIDDDRYTFQMCYEAKNLKECLRDCRFMDPGETHMFLARVTSSGWHLAIPLRQKLGSKTTWTWGTYEVVISGDHVNITYNLATTTLPIHQYLTADTITVGGGTYMFKVHKQTGVDVYMDRQRVRLPFPGWYDRYGTSERYLSTVYSSPRFGLNKASPFYKREKEFRDKQIPRGVIGRMLDRIVGT